MMKKTIFVLLLSLLALSSSLFAQGATEIGANEKVIQVVSLTQDEKDTYTLVGNLPDGSQMVYHFKDDVDINFPIDEIENGMYLAVKDTGIMTMSIPPQSPAEAIRNVTMAVKGGAVPFGNEAPALNISSVNLDDLFSRFSYAYGYLTTENYIANNVIFNGAYYAKGIFDAWNSSSVEPFFSLEEMNSYIEEYVNNVMNQGIIGEVGSVYTSDAEIDALPSPAELEEKFAYSYGYFLTLELLYQGYDLVAPDFASGALTALYAYEPIITVDEMNQAITDYNQYLYEQYSEFIQALAEENLAAAEAFLAENGAREEVTTLDSGVQIEWLSQEDPNAAMPTSDSTVIVDYTLTLLDGTVADQGTGVTFDLTSLIPGFAEAVTQMHVGDTIIAYIPPELGYGENGAGELIEPNSLLQFEIYLSSIVEE